MDKAYADTGCIIDERIKPNGSPAVFVAFTLNPDEGGHTFPNTIFVDLGRNEHRVKISKRHEFIHAMQWNGVPALHASPYNLASRYVLSPESWVLMTLLTERDAYAKTAWLNALDIEEGATPGFTAQAKTEVVIPADINLKAYDIRAQLQKASLCWDGRFPNDQKIITLLDHYIQQALRTYGKGHELRAENGGEPPVYIRLSQEDILAIGSTFGPSTFGDGQVDPVFTSLPRMRPDLWNKLQDLNRTYGISSEQNLPTLSSILAVTGQTPQGYMEASKAHTIKRPPAAPAEQSAERVLEPAQ